MMMMRLGDACEAWDLLLIASQGVRAKKPLRRCAASTADCLKPESQHPPIRVAGRVWVVCVCSSLTDARVWLLDRLTGEREGEGVVRRLPDCPEPLLCNPRARISISI